MKCKIFCFIIIYSLAFANGNVIYKDSTEFEEYLTNNVYSDEQFGNLEKITELKISESMIHLKPIITNHTKHLSNNTEQIQKLLDKSTHFEKNLMSLAKILINLRDIHLKSAQKVEERFNILMKRFENISEKTINVEKRFQLINSTLSTIPDKIKISSTHKQKREEFLNTHLNNCKEAMEKTNQSGIYEIQLPAFIPEPFKVLCNNEKHGGNWTVVMRRFDGSVDFNRNWTEYKNGFGNLSGEFFIGLEKLHVMTSSQGRQELLITMKDDEGYEKYISYDFFTVGNEDEGYALKELDEADGNVPNFFEKNTKFSTKDADNDLSKIYSCARVELGAGWHKYCYESNIFGVYNGNIIAHTAMAWAGKLLSVEMLIRPHE